MDRPGWVPDDVRNVARVYDAALSGTHHPAILGAVARKP